MKVEIIIAVLVERKGKVFFLPLEGKLLKLPKARLESPESPIDTARRLVKKTGYKDEAKISHLVGIYSLSDVDEDRNMLVFGFVVSIKGDKEIRSGKWISKKELARIVEEEKQLEDASIDTVILRDYLQRESYPLEILKRVEEVKL